MSCGTSKASIEFNLAGALAFGATGEGPQKQVVKEVTTTSTQSSANVVNYFSRDVGQDISFVKLLESGDIANAATIKGSISFANINSIIKSPVGDELYIWFEDECVNAEDNDDIVLTPFVCVHNNGSYTNLMFQDSQFEKNDVMYLESDGNVVFDESGNIYWLGMYIHFAIFAIVIFVSINGEGRAETNAYASA